MIEIECHMCGESYAAHILLGRGETRMQPEECAKCGKDTDAGLAVELHKDRVQHEAEEASDCERKR